ncbi:MAG: dTDP-4-dehydrorhamnose 3,5-epimerase [Bdellovibrio sp.]|nr:dTDP-4-dehydrorhamnose 3,5-epimerase [Bdellovibrio sp.]
MEIIEFPIKGLKLIKLKAFHDDRGFFTERFNLEKFKELGLPAEFVQDNFSRSKYGVLRGLHYQTDPAQGKLVTCLNGEIFDVAVDIRKDSPTYGQHVSVTLRGDEPSWFWIPAGFAHGFCVTSKEGADVLYKVDAEYNPKTERSLYWNSPPLRINWPSIEYTLSPKDSSCEKFT